MNLLNENEAKAFTDKILSFVKADDATASVNSDKLSHLRFANNDFLTSGQRISRSANVTVWIDGKRGSAATNDLDDTSLRAMVAEAEKLARLAPIDREYMPTLTRQTYKPVNGFVAATENVSLPNRAGSIGSIIDECLRNKLIGGGFHAARAEAGAAATKKGNFEFEKTTNASLSMTARSTDGTSSGYFLRSHYDIARLDTKRIAHEAVRKALEGANARTLAPGAYTVILEAQAVADLLGNLSFGFNARNAEEGRSVYSAPGGKTKLGEKIFDERINIYSDPWHSEVPGSQSVQGGIPAQKLYLVRNGVLENLIYNRYWAQQKGKEPTPGPVNTILESSAKPSSVEEMVKATSRGILVSRFWYIRGTDARTASSTGLTRDGVWLIENGKISYPVRNFRFNQSITKLLASGNVEMIGAPERVGSSEGGGGNASFLPALKVKVFNFTSLSEAV